MLRKLSHNSNNSLIRTNTTHRMELYQDITIRIYKMFRKQLYNLFLNTIRYAKRSQGLEANQNQSQITSRKIKEFDEPIKQRTGSRLCNSQAPKHRKNIHIVNIIMIIGHKFTSINVRDNAIKAFFWTLLNLEKKPTRHPILTFNSNLWGLYA